MKRLWEIFKEMKEILIPNNQKGDFYYKWPFVLENQRL